MVKGEQNPSQELALAQPQTLPVMSSMAQESWECDEQSLLWNSVLDGLPDELAVLVRWQIENLQATKLAESRLQLLQAELVATRSDLLQRTPRHTTVEAARIPVYVSPTHVMERAPLLRPEEKQMTPNATNGTRNYMRDNTHNHPHTHTGGNHAHTHTRTHQHTQRRNNTHSVLSHTQHHAQVQPVTPSATSSQPKSRCGDDLVFLVWQMPESHWLGKRSMILSHQSFWSTRFPHPRRSGTVISDS